MFPTTRKIVQTLTISWTLLVYCSTGDNSVNVKRLKEQHTSLALNDHQETDMDHVTHPQSEQPNRVHQSVQSTSDNVTNRPNISFSEKQYSTCDLKKDAMLISICPATAKEEDKTMCQSDEASPTVDTIFPVTDSVSGYHFLNFHCWRCFNQSGEPLTWSGELFYTYIHRPENYSSLSSFLRYVDENPAFLTWKPPSQFSYPECEDAGSSRCTICVPKETQINGCSLVGRPQLRVTQRQTHECYACTSHEAEHSSDNLHLCENIHPEEVTHISNWFNFFSPSGSRSSTLIIERIQSNTFSDHPWTSLECSVEQGTCSVTACNDRTLLLDGECDQSMDWFLSRYFLCEVKTVGEHCLLQKPRDFLDQQIRNTDDQPINTRALDRFDEESDSCPYETHKGRELNYSESITLKDILTTPVNQLVLLHEQTNDFVNLKVNITNKRDFDTIQIEVSGWNKRAPSPVSAFLKRLRSLVIQTMVTVGVKGNHLLCQVFFNHDLHEGVMNCQSVNICRLEIRERFNRENQPLNSDADRIKTAGTVSGLGIALIRMMLS